MFEYEINGKKYYQKPLVLGQVGQLTELLNEISLPSNLSITGLIIAFGNRLAKALSIVLIPEGKALKEKNLSEIEDEFGTTATIEIAFKVIEDFLDCNQLSFVFGRITGLMGKLVEETRR